MKQQKGFVLIFTLWIIAILALVIGAFATRTETSVTLARQAQDRFNTLIALNDSMAELNYRLATNHISYFGLGATANHAIKLDSQIYRTPNDIFVQLQDSNGLMPLNRFNPARMSKLLAQLDIPASTSATLIDALQDYTDSDNNRRLNGAEYGEYAAQGLAPPSNRPLETPHELQRVLGWKDLSALWGRNQAIDLFTPYGAGLLNPNTAPWEVLTSLPGVSKDVADLIIARRNIEPIRSGQVVSNIIGDANQMNFMNYLVFPSDHIGITLFSKKFPWAIRYNVALTPNDPHAPLRIDYIYKIAKPLHASNITNIPDLPTRSTDPLAPPATLLGM